MKIRAKNQFQGLDLHRKHYRSSSVCLKSVNSKLTCAKHPRCTRSTVFPSSGCDSLRHTHTPIIPTADGIRARVLFDLEVFPFGKGKSKTQFAAKPCSLAKISHVFTRPYLSFHIAHFARSVADATGRDPGAGFCAFPPSIGEQIANATQRKHTGRQKKKGRLSKALPRKDTRTAQHIQPQWYCFLFILGQTIPWSAPTSAPPTRTVTVTHIIRWRWR